MIERIRSANGNTIHTHTYPLNFDGGGQVNEAVMSLQTENSLLHLKEKWFRGIHISIVQIDPQLEETLRFESSQQHICFLFCLSGQISYDYQMHFNNQLLNNEQDINIGRTDGIGFTTRVKSSFLFIKFTTGYFDQAIGDGFRPEMKQCTPQPISAETGLILQQVIDPKQEGRPNRLFLEARVLELIIIYLNQQREKSKITFKQEDIDKIMLAKQLVEQNLQKPNSLIELSRKAGINDFKLKKGFKELVGHTVFGYLYKIRMEKAYYHLSKEKKTVNEVAFLVGYKNAQHFIAAFKKKYHVLPGSLNKS